jgi:hypothetical protein
MESQAVRMTLGKQRLLAAKRKVKRNQQRWTIVVINMEQALGVEPMELEKVKTTNDYWHGTNLTRMQTHLVLVEIRL